IDENLFRFQIFFQAPGPQLAAEAGLLVSAPWCLNVSGLHVIDPHDPGAQSLYHAKRFVNVTSPHRGRQTVRRVVRDADGIRLAVKRNHRCYRPEDFFASDARTIVHVEENRRLQVISLSELLGPPAADSYLGFLFSKLKIRTYAIVLLFTYQRAHLGFALQRRAQLDAFGLLGHGLDKFGIDLFLDENAAARRADFALVNEHAE